MEAGNSPLLDSSLNYVRKINPVFSENLLKVWNFLWKSLPRWTLLDLNTIMIWHPTIINDAPDYLAKASQLYITLALLRPKH